MTNFPSVVVPAVPPKGPQVNLVQSAVQPSGITDPSNPVYELTAEQLAALPDDQRAELAKRQGDSWVRGFTYQPESHSSLFITGACSVRTPLESPLYEKAKLYSAEGKELVEYQGAVYESKKLATKLAEEAPNKGKVPGTAGAALYWKLLSTRLGVPTNLPIVTVVPPVLVGADRCTTFGFEEHDFKGRAARLLENGTPWGVEREFWTGAQATAEGWPNPFLTNEETAVILNEGKEASAARGLQILQDAISQCGFGGQGFIHCEREAAPNLLNARRIGQDLYDVFDNLVIPGVGYTGSPPGGETAEEATEREAKRETWMYATDLVMVRKSQPEIFPDSFAEATDRGQGSEPNTTTFYAERFAVAYWDVACHFAVKVTLPA